MLLNHKDKLAFKDQTELRYKVDYNDPTLQS